jgi:hypothetical protein
VVADWRLEIQGHLYVPHGWLLRTSDDSLWAKLADYPHPDGPKGYMKYFFPSNELSDYLTLDVAREYNQYLVDNDLDDEPLLQDIDIAEHLQAAEATLAFPDELLCLKLSELYENPRAGAVGRVDFQLGGHISIIQCPLFVRSGEFRVESPQHPDGHVRPVVIEEPLRREVDRLVLDTVSAMDVVPKYLIRARDRARRLVGYQ